MLISRNGKPHPAGWTLHGQSAAHHLAGVLARGEAHAAIGGDPATLAAVGADLCVAAAAGDAGCGLGPEDKDGVRASLAGWFSHRVGAPAGVAIVSQCSTALQRAVEGAALARGVSAPLPIAIASTRLAGGVAQGILDGSLRFHELRDTVPEQMGAMIIDASSIGSSRETALSAMSPDDRATYRRG